MTVSYPSVTGSTSPALKSGIPYAVGMLEGDIKRTWDQTTSGTSARVACNWDDVSDFVEDMLGGSKLIGTVGTTGARISRTLPERCPYNDRQYCLGLTLIQTTGFNHGAVSKFAGWPEFNKNGEGVAVFEAHYAATLYELLEDDEIDDETDRFLIVTPSGVSENQQIPGAAFRVINDAIPADQRIPLGETGVKTGRSIDLQVKFLDVPAVNYTKIISLSNKVNAGPFTIGEWFTFPAETCLFKTWTANRKVNALGNPTFDISFTFGIKTDKGPDGQFRTWNKFWTTTGYVEVSHNGASTGNKVFQSGDLKGIFSMGS